jgi:hypothetical protein
MVEERAASKEQHSYDVNQFNSITENVEHFLEAHSYWLRIPT